MGDDRARAKLKGAAAEVDFDHVGMEVRINEPGAPRTEVLRAVAIVLEKLRPTNLRRITCNMTLTDEVDRDYDAARRAGVESFFPATPSHMITDFSFLLDGVGVKPAAVFQVEYGIVSDEEIPARISGAAGRVFDRFGVPHPPSDAGESGHPPVAVFLGISWTLAEPPPKTGVLEYLDETLQGLEDSSRELAGTVRTQLFGTATSENS